MTNNKGHHYPSGLMKGIKATIRARLIAVVKSRCCLDVNPVMRRGNILPRSVTNFRNKSTSL